MAKQVMQKDPRFRGLEFKVGIFVALALALLSVGLFFLAKEKGLFREDYSLYIIVDNAAGYTDGMAVKLSGIKIGRVKSINLADDAKVKIVLSLGREYQKWIRDDSVAKLTKEGVIGESVVEITPGKSEHVVIPENHEISLPPIEEGGGGADFTQSIQPLLTEATKTLKYVNDPNGEIKRSFINVEKLSYNLLTTQANMDKLIVDTNKVLLETSGIISGVLQDASGTLNKTSQTLDEASTTMQKFNAVVDKTLPIMDDVKEVSGLVASKNKNLKLILDDTEKITGDTEDILSGLKKTWPLNNIIKQKETDIIPLNY